MRSPLPLLLSFLLLCTISNRVIGFFAPAPSHTTNKYVIALQTEVDVLLPTERYTSELELHFLRVSVGVRTVTLLKELYNNRLALLLYNAKQIFGNYQQACFDSPNKKYLAFNFPSHNFW